MISPSKLRHILRKAIRRLKVLDNAYPGRSILDPTTPDTRDVILDLECAIRELDSRPVKE